LQVYKVYLQCIDYPVLTTRLIPERWFLEFSAGCPNIGNDTCSDTWMIRKKMMHWRVGGLKHEDN